MKFKITTINPSRDWRIIVSSFALVLIIISVFSWQIYLSEKIGGGYFSKQEPAVESATRAIDIKRLKRAVLIFEKRAKSFSDIKSNLLHSIDPSL